MKKLADRANIEKQNSQTIMDNVFSNELRNIDAILAQCTDAQKMILQILI